MLVCIVRLISERAEGGCGLTSDAPRPRVLPTPLPRGTFLGKGQVSWCRDFLVLDRSVVSDFYVTIVIALEAPQTTAI